MGQLITTFKEKKCQKQMKYERTLLRDLSMEELHMEVKNFITNNQLNDGMQMGMIQDYCYELVIEAFLVGAKYSRFGYLGETLQDVQIRSMEEEMQLVNTLYQFFYFSGVMDASEKEWKEMYQKCKKFIQAWWVYGFEKGKRRYMMRLS